MEREINMFYRPSPKRQMKTVREVTSRQGDSFVRDNGTTLPKFRIKKGDRNLHVNEKFFNSKFADPWK